MNKLKVFFRFFCVMMLTSALVSCEDVDKGGQKVAETYDSYSPLFDGVSLSGWKGCGNDGVPPVWTAEDGCLKSKADAAAKGNDIFFDKKFKNFELVFDWKCADNANSGVFYLGKMLDNSPSEILSLEYQIVGDEKSSPDDRRDSVGGGCTYIVGDEKSSPDDRVKNASLCGIVAPVINDAYKAGEWNTGKILCYKGTVIHYMNGKIALQYNLMSPQLIETLKENGADDEMLNHLNINGAGNNDGYIGLRYHGGEVWFRNIKVKELN